MTRALSEGQLVRKAAASGDIAALEEIAGIIEGFPAGSGEWPIGPWICHFVDCAPPEVLRWALGHGAPVDPEVEDGYPPIHCLLEGPSAHRYENLAILIAAGADVNRRGTNDWTPLHHAAARDDLRAMQMLLDAGADPSLRTRIDDYATPEEEARILGRHASADFIRDYRPGGTPGNRP